MRLFIAVDLDDCLKGKISDLQTRLLEPAAKPVERQNLHFTLKFLGEVPETAVPKIREALRTVKFQPFEIIVRGVGTFPPNEQTINIVWVGCEGPLAELAAEVERALEPLGFKPGERGFSSHLTVLRVKQRPTFLFERVKESKNAEMGSQAIVRFVLKKSTLTPQGPVYEDIETYKAVQ